MRRKIIKKTIGWREWISLNDLGVPLIKAKIDTGAKTSCLHAYDLSISKRRGVEYARFIVHPFQRDDSKIIEVESKVIEYRVITSSNGHRSKRPVIITPIEIMGMKFDIELTLANRDSMGFRMLLGRDAIKKNFLVDPGKSYFNGKPNKTKRKLI